MGGKGFLTQTLGVLNQCANTVDFVAHLIHAWTEDCTLDLGHVTVTVENAVNSDGVAVVEVE